MKVKKNWFKRLVAAVLAVILTAGLVQGMNLTVAFTKAEAETVVNDTTALENVYNRPYKDGIYVIRSADDPDLVLSVEGDVITTANIILREEDGKNNSQRFQLQIYDGNINYDSSLSGNSKFVAYGAYDADTKVDAGTYGIRAVNTNLWIHANTIYSNQDNAVTQRGVDTAADASGRANYRDQEGLWKFIHNEDGTFSITLTANGEYLYAPAGESGTALKVGTLEEAMAGTYKWYMEQAHLTNDYLVDSTYLIESGAATGVSSSLETEGSLTSVVDINSESYKEGQGFAQMYAAIIEGVEGGNAAQHFAIQKISGGFYTVVNVRSGRYLSSVKNSDGTYDIVEGGDSNGKPDSSEKWIIVPQASQDKNTDKTAGRFKLISAQYGLTLSTPGVANLTKLTLGNITGAATTLWYLKDICNYDANVERGETHIADSGVYADTFDTSDIVSFPIKIFDYAADGMLFEYASNNVESPVLQNPLNEAMFYKMGCNLGFSMVSRSKGGINGSIEWVDYFNNNLAATETLVNGSYSFDFNKYYAPYVSSKRFVAGASALADIPSFSLEDGVTASSVLISAGNLNDTYSGADYSAGTDIAKQINAILGYPMFGEQSFGNATIGLLETGLQEVTIGEKTYVLPRYKETTVEYIATMLQRTLAIPYKVSVDDTNITDTNKTATHYYNYVDGEITYADTSMGLDLASLLRGDTTAGGTTAGGVLADEIVDNVATGYKQYGTYAETLAKADHLIGTWAQVESYIDTCMDAAYWMLNSLFLENSYNDPQTNYTSLVLTKVTSSDGEEGYIFDSTFVDNASSNVANSAVMYNSNDGTIRNTSAAGKSYTYWLTNNSAASYPFAPVRTTDGDETNHLGTQKETESPYKLDGGLFTRNEDGSISLDSYEYKGTNFNYVLQANGNFVYHEEDGLFFDFEGDDDVYLFINGELVLDIGGAHAVTGARMNLNDYVQWAWELKNDTAEYNALSEEMKARVDALAISEGDQCTLDFYYMERHGYGSNMRIFTNIRVSSTDIDTEKTAYQDGNEIPYDGVVDAEKLVEYGFTLTNTSNHNLYCLSYTDEKIGVVIDYVNGLTVNSTQVSDKNGETLDAEDLVVTLIKDDGTRYPVDLTLGTQGAQNALRRLLADVPYSGVASVSHANGLLQGWAVEVRGIYYKLSDEQVADGSFLNEVKGAAWTGVETDKDLDDDGIEDGADDPNNPNYINPDRFVPSGSNIYDEADMRVRTPSQPQYYQWLGKTVRITKDRFIQDVVAAKNSSGEPMYPGITYDETNGTTNVTTMELSTSLGAPTGYEGVELTEDGTLEFTYGVSGAHSLNVQLTYTVTDEAGAASTKTMVVPVLVFVTNVQNKVFVLDYGLSVDLTEAGELLEGDALTAPSRDTVTKIMGMMSSAGEVKPSYTPNFISSTGWLAPTTTTTTVDGVETTVVEPAVIQGTYGIFTLTGDQLTYQPTRFMEGPDTIYVAIRVTEDTEFTSELGAIDENYEVEMYKSVTVLPANVVYYEDNFKGTTEGTINYTESASTGTIEVLGTLEGADKTYEENQSADQDQNYGFDDGAYAADQNVELSHGTCHKIVIKDIDGDLSTTDRTCVATFTFYGTGFELISRTNAYDSANIMIELIYPSGTKKFIPVITEFDHNMNGAGGQEEIYQVPVIRVEGLEAGRYTANIYGVPSYQWEGSQKVACNTTYLYVDGIRIYNPLDSELKDEDGNVYVDHYGDEKGAQFVELRDLILNGLGLAAKYTEDAVSGLLSIVTDNKYMTEDRNADDGYASTTGGLDQLNIVGPNNEVYINDIAADSDYAIVLNVKETGDGPHLLQIGVHDIDEEAFYRGTVFADGEVDLSDDNDYNDFSYIRVGVQSGDTYQWAEPVTITSGTEQYYTIDYSQCPLTEDGYYQVVIAVDGFVSFTNVKYNNLEFKSLQDVEAKAVFTYLDKVQAIFDRNHKPVTVVTEENQ